LPVKYDEKRRFFTTRGNFCSWQCAKAYGINMNTARAGEMQMFLSLMRMQTFGKYVPLWPAPKREALAIFGGTLSIEEFRSYGGKVEPIPVYFPDDRQLVQTVGFYAKGEVERNSKMPSNSRGKMSAIETSTSSNETLKLKRTKPLERSKSKLENVLGITRKDVGRSPVP
jgi:hypothetical protein